MNNVTRATTLEIDLNNFKYNINSIKQIVGPNIELMPVIKANAYGTYINKRLDILNMFNIVALATIDEAKEIRDLGYQKEIFVLNQAYISEINKIIESNITIGISSKTFLKELSKYKEKIKVHIELETGMNRTGVKIEELEEFIKDIPDNVIVDGVYTHMSSADIDFEYTRRQINLFNKGLDIIKKYYPNITYIHASASNALINFEEARFNTVRPGIIMYGYESSDDTLSKIGIKPVATLKSKIIFLKEVEEDESIGYSRSYKTNKKTKVATVPVGYADGFRRDFSNGWEVLINNKKAKIIGKVCMDSFMVDVTDIEVKEGDTVYIWNNKEIKLEDLSNKCNTINYEILCTISNRVPRVFINE